MPSLTLARAEDLEEFVRFLRRVHVHVTRTSGNVVVAAIPGAPSPLHEQRELAGYVATWNALHPGRTVTVEDA
ncbi:MAG TPA: hypothetical protein VFA05_06525 [Gaiellaceae bacterium]|nr:hypothetical protein [Gaiellaceae bacterium]